MKAEDYKAGFDMTMNMARMVQVMPTAEMLEALEYAEAFGPIIDPTLYREYLYSDGADIKRIIKSLDQFRRTVETIKMEHEAKERRTQPHDLSLPKLPLP